MNSAIGMLGFLSIFHIIGGVAVGGAVRHVIRGRIACNTPFIVMWGLIFGLAPLFIGFGWFSSHGALAFIAVELVIFFGALAVVAFTPDWFVEAFDIPTLSGIAFGGLFLVIGIAVGVLLATNSEPFMAIIFFGAFTGAGGLVLINGLHKLMTDK